MREYWGFVPTAVIGIPLAGFMIRDSMGYGGCFDFGPLLVIIPAVVVGSVLNVVYLAIVGVTWRTYFFDYAARRQRVIALCGFVVALALLVTEAVIWSSR